MFRCLDVSTNIVVDDEKEVKLVQPQESASQPQRRSPRTPFTARGTAPLRTHPFALDVTTFASIEAIGA